MLWLGAVASASAQTTTTFTTPGAYNYTVPAGVFRLQIQVAGAGGGAGGRDNPGTHGRAGSGGRVTAVIPVSPGQVISGTVGRGGSGGVQSPVSPAACAGSGAGGNPGIGMGGAGGNANCASPDGVPGSSGGGGGGGGGTTFAGVGFVLQAGGGGGGGGGSAGTLGSTGANASAIVVGPADCGRVGNGTAGASAFTDGGGGGGGGGGYSGGGGGSAGRDDRLGSISAGGGGGGGSCYLAGTSAFISAAFQAGAGGAGGSALGEAGSNGSVTITTLPTPATDLQMTKTVSPIGAVASGSVLTYTLVVTNNGPAATTNAVLRDTPGGTGLNCLVPSTMASCSASGGASCPAATVPVTTVGSGLTLPSMPVGGQVTVTFQCTVTATGR